MKNYDLIIIGAGASGIVAAITAKAKSNINILILEKEPKIAKKILMSGNGRCNIYNSGKYRYYGDYKFAEIVLGDNCSNLLKNFFEKIGVNTTIDDKGRAYPCTYQSETVVDALSLALERLNVNIRTNEEVTSINKNNDCFSVKTNTEQYKCSTLIVAMGTNAGLRNKNSSNDLIVKKLGFKFVEFSDALCPILTDTADIRNLSGLRVRGRAYLDTERSYEGEILFTNYGISGIASMQLARFIRNYNYLHLDLRESFGFNNKNIKEIYDILETRLKDYPNDNAEKLLYGFCNKKLAMAMMKKANIFVKNTNFKLIPKNDIMKLATLITDFPIKIIGTKGVEFSQVLSGGVETYQVNPKSMESKIDNLYICGEVLNVDGDTGGFNLMFAFKSGYNAGKDIENKFKRGKYGKTLL